MHAIAMAKGCDMACMAGGVEILVRDPGVDVAETRLLFDAVNARAAGLELEIAWSPEVVAAML